MSPPRDTPEPDVWLEHLIGKSVDLLQVCIRCGETVVDNTGIVPMTRSPGQDGAGRDFPSGRVYKTEGVTRHTRPTYPGAIVEKCVSRALRN